jgi:hexosaminidase
MKHLYYSLVLIIMTTIHIAGCTSHKNSSLSVIPEPVEFVKERGNFTITPYTPVFFNFPDSVHRENIISVLQKHLNDFYGFSAGEKASYSSTDTSDRVPGIYIILDKKEDLVPEEGYVIDIKETISLRATSFSGLFYGMQSLVQMMEESDESAEEVSVPNGVLTDYPRFSWRGLHLDVCRHFMPKEFVFRYLDFMAMHKLNTFHFHLTEDQGWRIEIEKYPKLTDIGSVREETLVGHGRSSDKYDGIEHGGYYTKEDIREIVDYASKRYITVVPEIEMPGHALAALASYPHLGCTGGPYDVATRWGVFEDIMCAGKESTFEFVEDVLTEVMEMFPSDYIHIGGDEAPKARWKECPDCQERILEEELADENQLQSYFIKRVGRFLADNGRKLIGWDEILEGGLAPDAAVMSWRGEAGGIEAAQMGHYVVMTPGTHCYLDHYQADPETQPLAIGGFTPLEKIYSYEPVPDTLVGNQADYIMGAQGNVWTEYMSSPAHVEYMVYPRAAALSEVVWSPKKERNYENFLERLSVLRRVYDHYNLNYAKVAFDE